jgi:hypothetical protein
MSSRAGSIALMLIAQIIALLIGGTPVLALEEAGAVLAGLAPGCDNFLQAGVFGSLPTSIGEGRPGWPRAAQATVAPQNRDVAACAHSLFEQPWWLDAVAPGSWDAATVTRDGEIIGRLPYVRMRRWGLTILGQPPLTQFLGPWIKPGAGAPYERLEFEHEVVRDLAAGLPKHDIFVQECHHSMTNCFPFHCQGFSQSVRYTYIIDDLSDHDKIWAEFSPTARTNIRKAERQVIVRITDDIEVLITLNSMSFHRQGLAVPYSADLIRRLDAACSTRGLRRIFCAEDVDGKPHAALFLVWDADTAYCLMSGNDPQLRHSGAVSLLRWEAIKFAGQVTRRFDFEGSMLQPVERFIRTFGGRQVQFPRLMHAGTLKGQLAFMGHDLYSSRKRQSANA